MYESFSRLACFVTTSINTIITKENGRKFIVDPDPGLLLATGDIAFAVQV